MYDDLSNDHMKIRADAQAAYNEIMRRRLVRMEVKSLRRLGRRSLWARFVDALPFYIVWRK